MGNNNKDIKRIKTRERVYKAIAQENGQDLFTLRTKLVKLHIVDSGNKFDSAIEDLKATGRIAVTGKTVSVTDLRQGTYFQSGNKSYVVLDGDTRQYGIDRKYTENAHSGDKVNVGFSYVNGHQPLPFIVKPSAPTYARTETPKVNGIPTLQVNENPNLIYGRVMKTDHDNLVFIPNDKKRFRDSQIFILNDKKTWAKYQDKICTMELVPNYDTANPMGFIKEIKGDAGNPIAEYDVIAESHGANMSWNDEVILKEIEKIPTEVNLKQFNLTDENGNVLVNNHSKENIVDLRHLKFTTTDPATCKDMDDAIYSTFDENGNLVVYTAVADVSRYVDLDSEIGKRYIKGGFTTYAPNKAYNILPTELSTGICSLNPNVDRLAFVVKTVINPKNGEPIDSSFMEAVIESKEKYSYEDAQRITDSHPEFTKQHLVNAINSNRELSLEEQVVLNKIAADILWKGFNSRNQIEFNTNNEYDVIFNGDFSNIVDIVPQENCAYHKVIEAFMVTANEASAKFALDNNIPIVYRVHDEPDEDRLEKAYEFFGYLDIPFDGDLSPTATKALIESVKGTSKEKVVNNFLVRLQSKAKYSITPDPKQVEFISDKLERKAKNNGHNASKALKNLPKKQQNLAFKQLIEQVKNAEDEMISHFGLQSKHYSHTTSPIRRITDYVTHYNIKAYLNGSTMIPIDTVREIALWANQMQDENDLAEREFNDLNSAIYCENNINKVMKGKICAFRYITEGKNSGIENLVVIVENEEKGIKVQIPAIEVLGSKIANVKNIGISQFGSAIINKDNSKALVTLCDEVEFKIASGNRITRECFASTNMLKDFTNSSPFELLEEIRKQESYTGSRPSSKRIFENAKFARSERIELAKREQDENARAKKAIKDIKTKGVAEDVTPEEAREFTKQSRRQAKSHRDEYRYGTRFNTDLDYDSIDEETTEDLDQETVVTTTQIKYSDNVQSNPQYDPYEDAITDDKYQGIDLLSDDDNPGND